MMILKLKLCRRLSEVDSPKNKGNKQQAARGLQYINVLVASRERHAQN